MNRVDVLKHTVNILAVVLMSAIAFLFLAYGFSYKNIGFVAANFTILVAVTGVLCTAIMLAGIIFYCFNVTSPYRLLVCVLAFIDVCAVVFYALCASGLISKINSVDALRAYIESTGAWAAVIYTVFCFLQVVMLPVPGSVAVAVGTAMFGPFKCSLYSFIGIVMGSIVAFAIGRWVGYRAVCWIVGKESLDKWLKKLKGRDYLILSLMFLLPLFPDDILCFVAGLSSMTWGYFVIMIIITRAISVFTSAYSFELIPFNTWWGILIWCVIVALVIASFWAVCKYYKQIDDFIKNKLKLKNASSKLK